MDTKKATSIWEINHADKNWMIQLGKISRVANRVVLKNFAPSCSSIGFVKTVSSDNNLVVRSWDADLVLEKRPSPF